MEKWELKHYEKIKRELEGIELEEQQEQFIKWVSSKDLDTVNKLISLINKIK